MADEVTFGYYSGATLTYGAYQPDGTVRTAAGTSLPEEGATGYYHADDASISAGDLVIVKDATSVVGFGEYLPQVVSDAIDADLTDIETKIDDLIVDQNKVLNVFDPPPTVINVTNLG